MMHAEAVIDGSYIILPDDGTSTTIFGHSLRSRDRRLAHSISGQRTFLAVRVIGTDISPTIRKYAISNAWFGSYGKQLNFKSQAEACSNNAFSVSKFQAPGVTEGVMEIEVANVHDAVAVVDEVLDVIDNLPVDNFPDHLILCYPAIGYDWAGWAYKDWHTSVYRNEYCLETCVQMHGKCFST